MTDRYTGIDLRPLRGVLIDLDDTLYAYPPAHEAGLTAAHAAAPPSLSFMDFTAAFNAARDAVVARLLPQGACRSRLLAFQAMFEAGGVPQAYIKAAELERIYWDRFIETMRPDPAAMDFLRRCKASAIPVCIVSDMQAHIQVRKIERLDIQGYAAHLVTSEETGAEKPAPRIFEAGLAKLGIAAAEAVMIGDNADKDIAGAEAAGIRAFRIVAGQGGT